MEEKRKENFPFHFIFFYFDGFPEALDSVLMYPLVWVLVVHQLQCVLQGDDRPGPHQAVTSLLVTSALAQPAEIYELTGGIETMNSTYFTTESVQSSIKSKFKQVKCLGFRLI